MFTFLTPILHPNVGEKYVCVRACVCFITYKHVYMRACVNACMIPSTHRGEVCAELLLKGSEWSPAQTMGTLLGNLAQLIMEPAPEQPLNAEAAELFVRSRADFAEATAAHARKFAM